MSVGDKILEVEYSGMGWKKVLGLSLVLVLSLGLVSAQEITIFEPGGSYDWFRVDQHRDVAYMAEATGSEWESANSAWTVRFPNGTTVDADTILDTDITDGHTYAGIFNISDNQGGFDPVPGEYTVSTQISDSDGMQLTQQNSTFTLDEPEITFDLIDPDDGATFQQGDTVDFSVSITTEEPSTLEAADIQLGDSEGGGTMVVGESGLNEPDFYVLSGDYTFTEGLDPTGEWNWSANAITEEGTVFQNSGDRTFTLDEPEIDVVLQEPSGGYLFTDTDTGVPYDFSVVREGWTDATVSYNVFGPDDEIVSVDDDNGAPYTNQDLTGTGGSFDGSFTWISEAEAGEHQFRVEATDGQDLIEENFTFTIDPLAENIDLTDPSGTYDYGRTVDPGIEYNFSVVREGWTDATISYVIFYPNGDLGLGENFLSQNISQGEIFNGNFTLQDSTEDVEAGDYRFRVAATDGQDLIEQNFTFTIAEPSFNVDFDLVAPEDGEEFSYGADESNTDVTFEGEIDSFEECTGRIVLNPADNPDEVVDSTTVSANTTTDLNGVESLSEGTWNWYMDCENNANELVASAESSFSIIQEEEDTLYDTAVGLIMDLLGGINDAIMDQVGTGGLLAIAVLVSAFFAGVAVTWSESSMFAMVAFVASMLVFYEWGYVETWVAFLIAILILVAATLSHSIGGD